MTAGPGGLAGHPATTSQRTAPRSILITAMGTRGDVQPFVALALHLQHVRGWRVTLAVPPEYRTFVESYGLQAEIIGISLQHAISCSPQGRRLRTASALTAFQATRDFFRLPLLESWFDSIRGLLVQRRPDAVLLSGFVALSGAAALPALLGLPTQVILAYTIPMSPTAEFGMPLAGTGFTAPAGWLNRLQWDTLDVVVSQRLHKYRAQQIVDVAVAEASALQSAGPADHTSSPACASRSSSCSSSPQLLPSSPTSVCPIKLGRNLTPGPVPTLYIYSPALLPKPADWPAHSHVVGPLLLRRHQQPQAAGGQAAGASVGLPAALQSYLDAAARAQLPVVYIGLGSMLGTVFEAAEVRRLVGCMEQAVIQVSATTPLCAVIHTTLVPGSTAQAAPDVCSAGSSSGMREDERPPAFFTLSMPVPHELLLPQVDLVIHHGGAGTLQAALAAGKPSLVVPCVPSSDQPFWADLARRRGLGPVWFPVHRLTTTRLASGIQQGLQNLRQYTAAAEELACLMANEDGVAAAADIIEASVKAAAPQALV